MSALVRKEIRILLPAWIAALVAATMPRWVGPYWEDVIPLLVCVPMLALVLAPFGLETSYGTFGLMLVQPEERRRFWRIKTRLLAVAMVSAWVLFISSLWFAVDPERNPNWVSGDTFPEFLKISALVMLVAFSGGLWTTLLLRDMVASFFCTWLIPTILSGVTFAVVSHWVTDDKRGATILCWVMAVYGVAGFFWARRLFLGAQDVPWTGGQISLTSVRGMSLRWLAFEFTGRQNPWTALVKKELQMQEITMFLIPVLALLHLAVLTAYHFAPQHMSKDVVYNAIPIIWLATVPIVIGCVTVAEERRLNTLEGLLCLPLTKRGQFAVKFAVALVLGIVFGGIMPWIPLHMGGEMPENFGWQRAVEIAAAITAISFYASTMSRGLLQALPTAVCVPVVAEIIIALFNKLILFFGGNLEFATAGYLFSAMAVPAMSITLVWLSFRNYKRLQIGWRVWLGDSIRAGAVFGCVTLAVIAIFDRSWELFQTLEPHHGPARIFGTGRASMGASRSGVDVLLPDGRIWIGKNLWTGKENHRKLTRISGGFADGSNWVELAVTGSGAFALQSDGTLWRIKDTNITQIGSDSDWKEIAGGGGIFRAVKQDGTLWGWSGMARINSAHPRPSVSSNNNYTVEMSFYANSDPWRIGNESNWVNVFVVMENQVIGVKRDGSTWQWGDMVFAETGHAWGANFANDNNRPSRCNMDGTNWLSMGGAWSLALGIQTDGSLWAAGYLPSKIFGEDAGPGQYPKPVRVGTKSDWVALSGNGQQAALEANGTLWTMGTTWTRGFGRGNQCTRPSKYADWLATAQEGQFTWALAKDGTLSCWDAFTVKTPFSGLPIEAQEHPTFLQGFCLGPTRRPVISTNILDR